MVLDQTLFNIAVSIVGALGGWWLKTMWEELKSLQKADREIIDRVASVEKLVVGNYVTRSELTDYFDRLDQKLDKISDKIDRKVDKP